MSADRVVNNKGTDMSADRGVNNKGTDMTNEGPLLEDQVPEQT
jgi:hypothetical protein